MAFSVIEKLTQLRDVLVGDRADGRLLAWSDADDAHVYIDPPDGGGDGSGLVLDDSGGQGWMVTADTDGALVTTATTEPGEDEVQVGPYLLSVDTDGVLVTTEV